MKGLTSIGTPSLLVLVSIATILKKGAFLLPYRWKRICTVDSSQSHGDVCKGFSLALVESKEKNAVSQKELLTTTLASISTACRCCLEVEQACQIRYELGSYCESMCEKLCQVLSHCIVDQSLDSCWP